MQQPIYLDNHATTAVDPRVLARMLPYFTTAYGNPASRSHPLGWAAAEAVEVARGQVAALLGCTAAEVVFTSGATEANNLALWGVLEAAAAAGGGAHLVVNAAEHRAVLDVAAAWRARGGACTCLAVDGAGRVDVAALTAALRPDTALVSLMLMNNEVGSRQPLEAVGAVCAARGILLHCDAVQGVGRTGLDVGAAGVHLASLSAHKIYGPKGVGALYVRRRGPRVRLWPRAAGGGQERGLRPGTLNVPGIVGFGEAARLLRAEAAAENGRLAALRDRLQARLVGALRGVTVNGDPAARHPGNLSVSFDGVDGGRLLGALRGLAVSAGSACSSESAAPSHVLTAMGLPAARAGATLRLGLGRFTTEDEVERAGDEVVRGVTLLRRRGTVALSPAGRTT